MNVKELLELAKQHKDTDFSASEMFDIAMRKYNENRHGGAKEGFIRSLYYSLGIFNETYKRIIQEEYGLTNAEVEAYLYNK